MNSEEWAKRNYTPPQDREYAVCDWCGLTTDPDGEVALDVPGDTQVVTRTDGKGNVVDRTLVHTECVEGRGPTTLARYA